MDRFDAMRAFVRVVEAGSFTKAAETLHMSRTSVTQLVQQLEAHLRVKLLNRTTRKVNVTEDGAVYYERVARLLSELEDVELELPGHGSKVLGAGDLVVQRGNWHKWHNRGDGPARWVAVMIGAPIGGRV